ncbi:MAG: Transglutaminase Domain-Containing Protein, partial [Clostridia bacterium]|nr:Transglutaminase Domain-Containing Protein [Clostridia bacterium]
DNIAIGKNDFERVLSLMNYVHNELFFVGNNIIPTEYNTYGIMKVRKTGALFCSYQATVLCEMLLSVGIKAIKISCLPKDFDYDRHVAVMIYINYYNKWVFFDPTFNTYFIDKNNIPLDIFEIRSSYKNYNLPEFKQIEINKQWTLVMNDYEYNTYDEWYSVYMVKNCFRFMCPKISVFNSSLNANVKYVFINPLNYNVKNEYDIITDDANKIYINSSEAFL